MLVLLGAARADAQLSPGPLTAAHAKLDDDQSCGKCHSSGKRVEDAKCLLCHPALAGRIAAGQGLHATYRGKPCADCHVEHVGEKARLIRWPGGAPEKLDHALAGWKLEGKHADLTCARCHDQKTQTGTPTFLGKKTACGSCHQDPHKGKFGAACASCHDMNDWKSVTTTGGFDHSKTAFPLLGKHVSVACKGCHGEPPRYTGIEFSTCASCHQDPHKGKFGTTCESCHTVGGWQKVVGFDAKHPALPLANGHKKVACRTCHDRGNDKPPSRGSECVSCHKPVHVAAFGTACKTCHATIKWLGLPREIGLAAHVKTSFALHGKHVDVPCATCHNPKLPEAKRFRGLPSGGCVSCHRDPHPPSVRAIGGGDCTSCHGDSSFAPSRFEIALHAKTGFVLDGKHEATPCSACHTGPRPRVVFAVAGKDCASCHANPHGDGFRTEMTQGGCAHCHSTSDWHRAKVDHSFWPLTGAHAQTACKSCHTEDYKAAPRTCDGCHADPHAGQFRLNAPVKPCEACHSTEKFAPAFVAVEHEKRTGFALTDKHADAACSACHKPERLRNGQTAVRWRLGYTACRACHADPHGGRS